MNRLSQKKIDYCSTNHSESNCLPSPCQITSGRGRLADTYVNPKTAQSKSKFMVYTGRVYMYKQIRFAS